MAQNTILQKVKTALRVVTDAFDDEISDLIGAARADLSGVGVYASPEEKPLVMRAVITYCRMSFGSPDDYDRLASAYDRQKSALRSMTGYTEWGGGRGQK